MKFTPANMSDISPLREVGLTILAVLCWKGISSDPLKECPLISKFRSPKYEFVHCALYKDLHTTMSLMILTPHLDLLSQQPPTDDFQAE